MFTLAPIFVLATAAAALHYEPRGHYSFPANVTGGTTPCPTAPTTTYTSCYTTAYSSICDDGWCPHTYTVTEYCHHTPCKPHTETGYVPPGFTTTTTMCKNCGTEPSTVTITIPCTTTTATTTTATPHEPPKTTHKCKGKDCDDDHDDDDEDGDCHGPGCPMETCYGGKCSSTITMTSTATSYAGCGGGPCPSETKGMCGGKPCPYETDDGCSSGGGPCPSKTKGMCGGKPCASATGSKPWPELPMYSGGAVADRGYLGSAVMVGVVAGMAVLL